MKKAYFAIILLIVGVGFAVPTYMSGVNYFTSHKYWADREEGDYRVLQSRQGQADVTSGDIKYAREKAESARRTADISLQTAVICGISSFVAFAVAVMLWFRYKREQRVMME